jgi:hypothetical protein
VFAGPDPFAVPGGKMLTEFCVESVAYSDCGGKFGPTLIGLLALLELHAAIATAIVTPAKPVVSLRSIRSP